MKNIHAFTAVLFILLIQCNQPKTNISQFSTTSRVESGTPVSVLFTTYSTTLVADGQDQTRLRVAVTDSAGREITSATDSIRIFVNGDAKIKTDRGRDLSLQTDEEGREYYECQLENGLCQLILQAGNTVDKIRIDARSGRLRPGGHEIHTIPAGQVMMEPTPEQLPETSKPIDRMIGADISFLPQLEDRGRVFSDQGIQKDAIEIMGDHGFNYIRLRIFVNPENENGYSPERGFCGLSYTLGMAARIKAAGMKILLNFHYSDYWADPQQQNKPLAWANLDHEILKDSLREYTRNVIQAFIEQGTPPDMVQIGNEINHGMLWPDGHIGNLDGLAGLLIAGVEGAEEADPDLPVMMHIALGGQNDESVFWLDNMIARGVRFDIIGLSYYPNYHGTLDDLDFNLRDLIQRYHKPLHVVEYSAYAREVHDIVFNLPGDMGKGTCIWEPIGFRGGMFDASGEVTDGILVYDELRDKYLLPR